MSEEINKAFYNSQDSSFDKIPFGDHVKTFFQKYAPPSPAQVLEIGCGGGALAYWISQLGYEIECLEPAEKQAARSLQKGLKVSTATLQEFDTDQKYDIIVAISSLIHIPKKDLPAQIHKITRFLKPSGHFLATFLEGEDEIYEDPTNTGKTRFFSKHTQHELHQLLSSFQILEEEKIVSKSLRQAFFLIALKPL